MERRVLLAAELLDRHECAERVGRHRQQAVGRSPYLQSVHVEDGRDLIGKIAPVRIVTGQQNSLSHVNVRSMMIN